MKLYLLPRELCAFGEALQIRAQSAFRGQHGSIAEAPIGCSAGAARLLTVRLSWDCAPGCVHNNLQVSI